MIEAANSKDRRLAACVCLLALVLVYAPVASATLLAATGACCTGEQCPIHGNHRPAQPGPAQSNENAPMDCDHHGQDGHATNQMKACSMSCCHTAEQSAVNVHFFLLAEASDGACLARLCAAQMAAAAAALSLIFPPQAPPPKSLAG